MNGLRRTRTTMPKPGAAGFVVHLAMFVVMLPVALVVVAVMAVAHILGLVEVREASDN